MHYGIIRDGKLLLVPEGTPNAKPVVFAEIPEFDQEKQAVFQLPPADVGSHIFVGVEVRDLPPEDVDGGEFGGMEFN